MACVTDALYLANPYLFETTVLLVELAELGESKGAALVFDRTILYPEGGGQPADRGTAHIALPDGGGDIVAEIIDVQHVKSTNVVRHVCAESLAADLPRLREALAARGSLACKLAVDVPRRLDHMQQHTSQHVLTAVAQDVFSAATTGWGLLSDHTTIDIECAGLDPAILPELERRANAEIRQRRQVISHVVNRAQLDAMMANATFRSRGIADGIGDEGIRLVEIEGLDLNTCGGTHVANTAELQVGQCTTAARCSPCCAQPHGVVYRSH